MKMLYPLAALAIVASLSSCQTAEQRQAQEDQDRAWCQANGATGTSTPQCMISRQAARDEDRRARFRAIAEAGARIQRQQAYEQQMYNANRPRTTNCYQYGNSVQCTTM